MGVIGKYHEVSVAGEFLGQVDVLIPVAASPMRVEEHWIRLEASQERRPAD
jgi:hypothetical protein